ncbi:MULTISPECIES: hypothetical protein [Pseudomonas syringae group]|uniref:Uncharacterized protein n=1 Tax=Pseudomonas syringae pv. coriandricola TaxID=264453 RepID=A0A0P9RA18_9PSED|nr:MULTISPECIES: hypothetical protein [Pseudomonas syringae group]KPW80567.1 Uncharacterized protein ALO76_00325 [Pseudomonas syringae pv. coriandricola]RMN09072.1 hypothetical protein ALQ65_01721 [Pseudomonas syringae pv. coriandricola]
MIFDRNRRPVIGIGNGVAINGAACRLAWRTLRPSNVAQLATRSVLPSSGASLTNAINSALQLFDEAADMNQWGDDFFDVLIIHLPADGSASATYKHLIRVARQGVIILS